MRKSPASRRRISLDGLELIDAVDRAGSFSAAGALLDRVTSTVSYAVMRLEEDLNVVLFERNGPRVRLTAAGKELLTEGRLLLRAAEELECRVKRVASGWESEVRVALDSLIAPHMLASQIEQFHAASDTTRIKFTSEALTGSWEALLDRRADLAVAAGDGPSGGGYRFETVAEIAFVFCVAPTHPLARQRRPLTETEIARHRAIAVSDSATRLSTRTVGVVRGQRILCVPDMASKFALQVAGVGVGFLPQPCAQVALDKGLLVERTVVQGKPPERLSVAWRAGDAGRGLQWWVERLTQRGLVQSIIDRTAKSWLSR